MQEVTITSDALSTIPLRRHSFSQQSAKQYLAISRTPTNTIQLQQAERNSADISSTERKRLIRSNSSVASGYPRFR